MSLVPAFDIGIWNAWIFMSVFILQMLAVFLMGKGVWQRSGHPADVPKSNNEKRAGIIGNSIWALATFYSIFLPLQQGTLWFSIGFPIFFVGVMLLTVTTAEFAVTPSKKPITRGIYALSRHPMYLASFLIYIGTGIASASWLFLLLALANIYWVATESRVEERYCLEKYGEAYRRYMERTPRWFGIPKSRKKNDNHG
jgi:protein-S-isoprenylcysteine O-methyltransferase Ste14